MDQGRVETRGLWVHAMVPRVQGGGWKCDLSRENWHFRYTPLVPSQENWVSELIRRRTKGVVGGEFIGSVRGVDELRDRRRILKVWDALRLHDLFD